MNETRGALFKDITATELIHSGYGKAYGVIVNSHSSGTMKLLDGVDDTAGTQATGTLTIAGGSLTPAVFAQSVLTSDGTDFVDGATITIGSIVYRAKTVIAQAYDFTIVGIVATDLATLAKAINGTGTVGIDYYAGTLPSTTVVAVAGSTTVTCTSQVIGTANNTLATTTTSAHLSWSGSTLSAGTAGVSTATAGFSINGQAYYFTKTLTETVMGVVNAVPNEILWVTSDATAMANMKKAINASGTEGTDYGTGTVANTNVVATTNSSTTQVVQAIVYGTLGNQITTTSTLTNATWGAATLAGATNGARLICNTFTFPTGSGIYKFPEPINFVTGLYFIVGGTLDCTVLYN